MSNKNTLSTVLLFVAAIIWGAGFIASKFALEVGMSAELMLFSRFFVAAIALGIIFFRRIREKMRREQILPGIFLGIILFLGFYFQGLGLELTTPANNAFLTSTNVIMVPFIAWIIFKKRPGGLKFVTSAICLIGIFILSANFEVGFSMSLGDILTLICAFFFACQIVFTGKLARNIDATVLVFIQILTSTVLSFIMFLINDGNIAPVLTVQGILPIIFLGLFSTLVCYLLQTFGQQHIDPSKAAMILSTEGLFGSIMSVMLGYDSLKLTMVIGGGVILLSVLLSEASFKKKEQPQK